MPLISKKKRNAHKWNWTKAQKFMRDIAGGLTYWAIQNLNILLIYTTMLEISVWIFCRFLGKIRPQGRGAPNKKSIWIYSLEQTLSKYLLL